MIKIKFVPEIQKHNSQSLILFEVEYKLLQNNEYFKTIWSFQSIKNEIILDIKYLNSFSLLLNWLKYEFKYINWNQLEWSHIYLGSDYFLEPKLLESAIEHSLYNYSKLNKQTQHDLIYTLISENLFDNFFHFSAEFIIFKKSYKLIISILLNLNKISPIVNTIINIYEAITSKNSPIRELIISYHNNIYDMNQFYHKWEKQLWNIYRNLESDIIGFSYNSLDEHYFIINEIIDNIFI